MHLRNLLHRNNHGDKNSDKNSDRQSHKNRNAHTTAGPAVSKKNARAVADYEQFLAKAPKDTIERAHIVAFEKLTPEQLDLVFQRFNASLEVVDRPSDRRPQTLARTAVQAETRDPGFLGRTFSTDALLQAWLWSSVIETVTISALTSAAWAGWSSEAMTSGSDAAMTGGNDGFGWWDWDFF